VEFTGWNVVDRRAHNKVGNMEALSSTSF
jgi:hypothetical protein